MSNNETPSGKSNQSALNIAIVVVLILLCITVGYLVYTLLSTKIENEISRRESRIEYTENTSRETEEETVDEEIEDSSMEDEMSEEEISEYILPDSDSKYLSESDLEGLSAEDCRLARNEIYARHGRMFDAEELQQYFSEKSWYVPTYAPSEFQESWLNDYEVYNRDLIVEYEKHIN